MDHAELGFTAPTEGLASPAPTSVFGQTDAFYLLLCLAESLSVWLFFGACWLFQDSIRLLLLSYVGPSELSPTQIRLPYAQDLDARMFIAGR